MRERSSILLLSLIPHLTSSRKRLSVAHVKTLKMSEDVLAVQYSPDQKLLAVALLDSTVKVFFADSLKVVCVTVLGSSRYLQPPSPSPAVLSLSVWA